MGVAVDGFDFGAQRRANVRFAADLVDQVVRHALFEQIGAYDQGYGLRMIGEEHCGLAGRISGADEMHIEPMSDRRFAPRGSVENPFAKQSVETVRGEATPAHTGRDNDSSRIQDLLVIEHNAAGVSVEADNLARDENLSAQALGLPKRPACELRARDPAWKPQIVLDPR